jgi:hypothetical protein
MMRPEYPWWQWALAITVLLAWTVYWFVQVT